MKQQISLSHRQHSQDLTLGCWLVEIFTNIQINLIDCLIFHTQGMLRIFLSSFFFGKFCLSLPGQKIVCKILLDQCEDSLDFGERIFKEILTFVLDERFPEVESLTEQQMKALFVALNRKVVFAILPTRHRKSMIFQLLLCKYKINWFKRHTKR